MRKATENQGNTRTVTEYRSARAKTKGKDHTIQQYLQPNFSSCHQETPMKPSQIQNRLSQPPTRRILPLPNPELSRRDRPGPPWHASNTLGTFHSPVFVHSSPTSTGRPHHARDGLGPPQCFGQPQSATISTTKIDTLANRPQYSSPHPASSQFMRDLSNHSPSSHIRRDQAIESKVTQSHSGSKTVTPKSQELNKAQSSETKFSIPTVQLHRLPVTLSSGSLTMYSRLAPPQQQHKPTSSNNAPIPVVDSSRKKQWDLEHSDNIAKKLCVQGVNSWKAETSKPADRTSLSTSQVLLSRHSPDMKLSPRTTEPFHQSACVEPSSIPKTCLTRPPPMGAKQALVNSCQSHIVKLRSPPKSCVVSFNKRVEENYKTTSSNLSGNIPRKDTSNLPEVLLGSNQSGHVSCNTSVILLKTPSRDKQEGESRNPNICTPRPASKTNSGSQSHLASKRNKTAHSRKRPVVADDVDELFTPDPMTYVVSPTHKMAKPKLDCETVKLPVSDKCCSSGTATSSSTRVNGPTCHKTQTSTVTSPHVVDQKVLFPTVTLVRLKPSLKNNEHLCFTDKPLKNCPIASLGKPLKEKCVKADEKVTSPVPISSNVSETGIVASKQTPMSTPSQSPPLKRQAGEEDPIDVELGLSFALDLDLTQSSHSSEEEQLLSLQEMMERVTKPPDTPEKGAFSEPSTPGHHSCQSRSQPLPSTTNSGIYKNSLDQMLMEISTTKKAKEIETQLLTACKEDLLRIAEYEENQEEGISTEQQEFLQRYSLMSNAIREVPPGEVAFNLEKFGQIFNQDTLQLRQCMVNPQGAAQKTLLWSSPAQLRLHVTIGLFQEAYEYSFCPAQVTRFLFKMMSVNSERLVSEMMLQALCDIACTAAYQRVKNRNQQFKVWVPSLADVTLVLMNMGVAFVTLFPFENLQPSFTEGDLLEDENVTIETPSSIKDLSTFPEHNCNNILKYLSYCMGLCPRAYSDDELLLLLTVMGRIGLDPRLILKSSVELYPLQYKLVNNIRSWDNMLPRICRAYTDLTDDHHNMCQLVQMLPDSTRGRQLRRHLSLSMISKLLDRKCTYTPTEKVFQLSRLRRYLPRMQPSTILRAMLSAPSKSQKDKEDMAILDQQAYYLCYSLLTLANEASNFHFFPAQQKGELLILCSQLETHVKCDIRESEKCLYRSKVKDLVARIYTKWQMLLQRTRPLHGKLYDYWQPLPMDTLSCSQEEQTTDNSDDEEGTVVEEDPEMEEDEQEKDTSESEENEDLMIKEQEEENPLEEGVICDEKLKTGGHNPDNPNQTESAVDPVPVDLKQEMSEVQKESKATDEYTDGGGTGPTEKEAKMIDASVDVTSQHNQVTACDLV